MFLVFCKAFEVASGEATASETRYWDIALEAETNIRKFLVENEIQIVKQDEFELAMIADGLSAGDNLVITPLGQVSSGTQVTVMGSEEYQATRGKAKRSSNQKPPKEQGAQ